MKKGKQTIRKIILYTLIAVAITSGIVIFWVADLSNSSLGDKIEIYVLTSGLIITSVMTGVGLWYTSKENREARKERNLSLVGTFSAQLTALKDKERNLKSQKDCETYAQNYVDLLDQIAYLYIKGSLPDEIADFFENELSYSLTMIKWMNENKIENYLTIVPKHRIKKFDKQFCFIVYMDRPKANKIVLQTTQEFDENKNTLTVDKAIISRLEKENELIDDEIKKLEEHQTDEIKKLESTKNQIQQRNYRDILSAPNDYQIDKQFPWTSLLERCLDKKIVPFGVQEQLPKNMLQYDQLPSDERDRIMEVINKYSTQITELKSKEESLATKNDCETYAANFVDLMDQIAFLHEKNTFPNDIDEYFENEFEYALTLILWLENNKINCELRNGIEKFHEDKVKTKYEWMDLVEQYKDNLSRIKNKDSLDENGKKQKVYTWNSLLKWSLVKDLVPLENNPLPLPMQEYTELPDENMGETMDLIKNYGDKLSDLTQKEKSFKDDGFLECELYANSYLDLVDTIAFLYRQKVIPTKVAEYFENNFCYSLTLYNWLKKNKLTGPLRVKEIDKQNNENVREIEDLKQWVKSKKDTSEVLREFTWTDLMSWCKLKELDPFEEDQLPPIMRNMKVPEEYWLDVYKKNLN